MSNYSSLKATINANIKTNGNQEITGSVMNSVLTAMVNTLGAGYMFAGIASPSTNPGSPDSKVFYLASIEGTYTNFGGLVVNEGEIALLRWDSSWHKDSTGVASAKKLCELDAEVNGVDFDGAFSISATGEHSSNLDRIYFPNPIPTGQYVITIKSGTTGNTGTCQVFVKYSGQSSTTSLGSFTINNPKTITLSDSIESIGIYMSAGVNQHTGNMPLTIESPNAGIRQKVDGLIDTIIPGIQDDVEKNRTYLLNNFFPGNGASFSNRLIYGLKPGKTYKLTIQDPSLLTDTTIDTTTAKFLIRYEKSNGTLGILARVFVGGGSVNDSYTFTIPADLKENGYVEIGGRAIVGVVINFSIAEEMVQESVTYGVVRCSTAAATETKAVTIPNISSINTEKIRFVLIFSNPTTISASLSINGEAAKPLYYNGARANSNNSWATGEKLDVTYNANYPAYFAVTIPNLSQSVNSASPSRDKTISEAGLVSYVEGGGDKKVSQYNIDKESAIVSAASRSPLVYEKVNKELCPVFSILTDLHSDLTRFNRACEFADNNSAILATLCLGDLINTSNSQNPYPLILNFTKPVISITGNHEVLKKTSQGISGWSESDIISNMYNPDQVAHNGEIHPEGKCYWYKDFSKTIDGATKKLRVIGLHQYESNGTGEQNSGAGKDVCFYTQDQIDWLIQTLAECDSNTYVMLLIHFAPTSNMTRVECPFTPSASFGFPIAGGSNTGGASSMSDNEFIPKIIQAWIDGTTLNISCDIVVGDTTTHITAVKSTPFASHSAKFAGYFCGHTHRDFIGFLSNYPKQMQFAFIATTADQTQQLCDIGRNTTGKTQDCFTIVGIDWFKNSVSLVRIGADETTDMRERKFYNIPIPV